MISKRQFTFDMALLSRKEFIKIDIRLGHSLSYRQANAMTWTVSFHFPSNNVVLLTRNYSNQLQSIYNNSLALHLFTPKNNKKIYCKYCRNPLWHFHSFRSHFPRMMWNIQVCFIQNLLLEAAHEGWTDESDFSLDVFVFLWLWESMNDLVLLFAQRSLSFCRSQKRAVFIQQTRCKWAIQLFVKTILPL